MDAEGEDPKCCRSNCVLAPVSMTGKGQMLSAEPCCAIRPSACTPQVQEDCCKASHLLASKVTYGALTSTPVQYKPAATPPMPPGAFPTLFPAGASAGTGLRGAKAGAFQRSDLSASDTACQAKHHLVAHSILSQFLPRDVRKHYRCGGISCMLNWDYPLVSALDHLGISWAKRMDSSNGCWQHFLRFSRSLVSVTSPFISGRNTRVLWEYKEGQVAQRLTCRKVCKQVDCKITESKYWLNGYINMCLSLLFRAPRERQASMKAVSMAVWLWHCPGVIQTPHC